MFELLRIGARNVARNRRRSVLNILALSVGMTMMIAALGWVRGYFTTLYTGMMAFDTGQAQILHRDYLQEERRVPLDLVVEHHEELRTLLMARYPEIQEAGGRIHYTVEVGNGREYLPMIGRAVDPDREQAITTTREYLVSGHYLTAGEPGVLIGAVAARRLGVSAGDTVFLRVRDRYGAPNTTVHSVAGVFHFGYPLFDRNLLLSDLAETRDFLRIGHDGVTHLVLRLTPGSHPERTARRLAEDLPLHLEAYPWQRFARTMIAAVEADRGAFLLFTGILFLLSLLGIRNSMSMVVRERSREIGTMRAIGLKKRRLMALLLSESIFLALVAALVSWVVGGALAAYVQFHGFDIASALPDDLPIPFGDRFYGDYRLVDFLISTGFGVSAALLGTLIPARRALRLRPADTLRRDGL